jgi:osmotically-inducible protein OsmY
MTETIVISQRPDIDIEADIDRLITYYPPLQKDRNAIRYQSQNGIVTISGHVQTPNSRRYLLGRLPKIAGVVSVHDDQFFDDETTRIEVGRTIPVGVVVGKVFYGTVILSGKLPEGMTVDELAAQVAAVPGVRRVVTDF